MILDLNAIVMYVSVVKNIIFMMYVCGLTKD